MIHHYITGYTNEEGRHFIEAWLQINFLRWCFCFSKRKVEIIGHDGEEA